MQAEKKLTLQENNVNPDALVKYKKVEGDIGRCMFAFFCQNHEDKLANFTPCWMNIGQPDIAKEMVCLR